MRLETERLILREMVVGDATDMFEMDADPQVYQYTGDFIPKIVEDTRERIRNYPDYKKYGYGRWTTLLKETNEIIGWCGLKYIDEIDEVDIGYRWKPKFWGNGYATEASKACLEFGFKQLGVEQIVGQLYEENKASIRVLEKIGMTFWKEMSDEKESWWVYRITKEVYSQLSY